MSSNCTPAPKTRKSTNDSRPGLTDQSPAVSQSPLDPPRRTSSLALSRIIKTPPSGNRARKSWTVRTNKDDRLPDIQSNIGKKRTAETHLKFRDISQGHASQIQKVLQTAQANLQLDMHFAASPVGSISSRLPQPDSSQLRGQHSTEIPERSAKVWRHSRIPDLFSVPASDVREPLPDASPPLPEVTLRQSNDNESSMEPTSSGFASPLTPYNVCNKAQEPDYPPLPRSSSPIAIEESEGSDQHVGSQHSRLDVSDLTQPMTGLKVSSDYDMHSEKFSDRMDDSPTLDHLRRKLGSCVSSSLDPPHLLDSFFLSKSAKAAAESARAKRGLPKQLTDNLDRNGVDRAGQSAHSAAYGRPQINCPDPGLHQYLATAPCPNPFAHLQVNAPETLDDNLRSARMRLYAPENQYRVPSDLAVASSNQRFTGFRTTAAGSPMPFAKRLNAAPVNCSPASHLSLISSSPAYLTSNSTFIRQPPLQLHRTEKLDESFRPELQYQHESFDRKHRPATNLYSFSTAAAKATGESAAPDSRIRDSYRTDTLTMMARPPGRFRRTGISASLQFAGSRPRHSRIPQPRLPNQGMTAVRKNRNYHPAPRDMEFRSSPPRPSAPYQYTGFNRKRSKDDSYLSDFEVAEDDELAVSSGQSLHSQPSEEIMRIDDSTRAAVRMSLFGPDTPECLQGTREGIRELSPNISVWRKGMRGAPHSRKKRRPSYWDGDLEEVMMSPACRGGIESSPTISKRSMVAELENTSSQADSGSIKRGQAAIENTNIDDELQSYTTALDIDMAKD